MPLTTITPEEARRLIDDGAVLVDIRERDEYARANIPGARHAPLSRWEQCASELGTLRKVIFHCRAGARTLSHAARLEAPLAAGCEAYALAGGLDAWRRAGLPVATDARQPLELQRQVQIAAGSLAFAGTVLGVFANPLFLLLPAVVGAGLLLAGTTGFCGMARLLLRAPWNRRLAARCEPAAVLPRSG
jgi:rhodanese-related sulfurtransferase